MKSFIVFMLVYMFGVIVNCVLVLRLALDALGQTHLQEWDITTSCIIVFVSFVTMAFTAFSLRLEVDARKMLMDFSARNNQ